MSRIVIFSGTTEGRTISEKLCNSHIRHVVCVATDYGQAVMTASEYASIRTGRMDAQEMTDFLKAEADIVVDATHPYATAVTKNIRAAAREAKIRYIRALREKESYDNRGLTLCSDVEDCRERLKSVMGNILLTTGSKDLGIFCQDKELRERIFARVLPAGQSLSLCEGAGLSGRQIIAMQGPFSKEMNKALIEEYQIKCLVTKESGAAGGFMEKICAAEECGISTFVIGRPLEAWDSEAEACTVAEALEKLGVNTNKSLHVDIIGCGMGALENLTVEAAGAIKEAAIVFGARRLVEQITDKRVMDLYLAEDIIPELAASSESRFAVLFSGDSGFFSGTKKFLAGLKEFADRESLELSYRVYPGISSVSYLAARLGVEYSEAYIDSLHGRNKDSLSRAGIISKVITKENSFLLLSGHEDVNFLGQRLMTFGEDCFEIILGSRLSYEDEQLIRLTAGEAAAFQRKGLYTAYIHNLQPNSIKNSNSKEQPLIPVKGDDEFIRDKVPMSKEVIRHESIIKLGLKAGDVVYDVGSGTGSVAIEMAGLSPELKVYAIEKKPEAVSLIQKNIEAFSCHNIELISGDAAESIAGLPAPDAVFIGGSGGRLMDILGLILDKTDRARIVINAVSLETMAELRDIEKGFELSDFTLQQISVAKGRRLGDYNMMMAENPVMICSFVLRGSREGRKND